MIDQKLIYRKINLIGKDLQALKPISRLSEKEYFKKKEYEILTERYLERIITRVIDINYHLIVETGNPPPKDYFNSFIELGKMRILPYDFSQKMARYAGLRNRLVHEYNSLDEKRYIKLQNLCSEICLNILDKLRILLEKRNRKN